MELLFSPHPTFTSQDAQGSRARTPESRGPRQPKIQVNPQNGTQGCNSKPRSCSTAHELLQESKVSCFLVSLR